MAQDRSDNSRDESGDEAILEEARDRFKYAEEADGDNRRAQLEDTEFVYKRGAQWDQETRDLRKKWGLPSLEFNQLRPFVHQVTNDMRQGRPGVKFSAASGDASEKVADLKQDLVRGIELKSDAESAYDTGFQHSVLGGSGYWRIRSDYESRKSFNQCLKIDRIADPQCVRIDPDYENPDASDVSWAFVVQKIKKADYERRYKDKPLSWRANEDTQLWYPSGEDETVFIADYYRIVTEEADLVLLSNGTAMWADDLETAIEGKTVPEGVTVVKERRGERRVCEWYTLGGGEQVLEQHEWKGSFVPIVLCAGDEIVINGKRLRQGLIRHAREPQQMYNFAMSNIAHRLSHTPMSPWVAAVESTKGFESVYETANTTPYSVLPYHAYADDDDKPLPAPVRQPGADLDAGFAQFAQTMTQQIRATLGMFEDAIGMRGQAQSGRAILAREKQGDNATFHYIDNLRRAIQHTGRIIEDLIPHYYDTERLVALVAHDGAQRMEQVNGMIPSPDAEGVLQYIRDPDNDLTRGEYAVSVESGPSYATKKEETRATLVELFQAYPPAAQVLGDKLVQVIDMPDAKDAAERMKMLLPPQIQAMEAAKQQGKAPPDPQMMQQMQQLQMQIQQAGEAVQVLQQENATLKQDQQAKMAEAQMDAQTAQQKIEAESRTAEQKAMLDAQAKVKAKLIDVAGDLMAEHLGMRAQAASMGEEGPAPVDMGSMMQGVEHTAGQVERSMMSGSPMPMPMMGPRAPKTGPSEDAVVMLEGARQIAEALAVSISQAMMAPKAMKVEFDEAGNVIGGVSVPATMQ